MRAGRMISPAGHSASWVQPPATVSGGCASPCPELRPGFATVAQPQDRTRPPCSRTQKKGNLDAALSRNCLYRLKLPATRHVRQFVRESWYPPFLDELVRTYLEHASSCRFVPKMGEADRTAKGKPRPMLTRKQHELLVFIDRHLKQTGFSPSFEEMKEALQLKSKSGIHRLISALEERGFLAAATTAPARWRCCACRRTPSPATAEPARRGRAASSFSPNVIRGDFSPRLPGCAPPTRPRRSSCRCTAASPPACRSRRCATPAARSRCRWRCCGGGEHYALEVAGDSMVEAGILDGDTVIIRKGDRPRTARSWWRWWTMPRLR